MLMIGMRHSTGYSPEEGVGSVQDADQEKVIELTYGFETTFTTSPATQGVEITIDGNNTITTGQDGIATINLSTERILTLIQKQVFKRDRKCANRRS